MTEARTARVKLESTTLHVVGLALMFVAVGMAASMVVDLIERGDAATALLLSAVITGAVGVLVWRSTRVPARVSPGAALTAVASTWLAMSVAGALPYLFAGVFDTLDDALFESISGFTCTGSTILAAEDFATTSRGIMFWRQLTQWFGGMGVVVLAVAVLPFLGVGGLELIRAEAPGPTSDRLAPRVSETAKRLWLVYLGFTVLAVVALLVVRLSLFDAVGTSFSLVSTGGFSPHVESIGFYDSVAVEVVVVIGMILGAANFTLHWRAVNGEPGCYPANSELRAYLAILGLGAVLVTVLHLSDGFSLTSALRNSVFNVTTLGTSTGYSNASSANPGGNFASWLPSAQIFLLALMISGGMTGSTSGAVKVLRVQVMIRVARRQLRWARHPRAILPVKQGTQSVDEEIVARIVGFVLLYFVIGVVGLLVVVSLGSEIVEGLSGVLSAMGNMGPALGDAGPTANYLSFTRPARAVLAFLMLVGRLEVFPMVLLFVVAGRRLARHSPSRLVRRARRF